MNVKEANREFCKLIKMHLITVQSGEFGNSTLEDLAFCGKMHSILENYLEVR